MFARPHVRSRFLTLAVALACSPFPAHPLLADTAALWDSTTNNWSAAAHWSTNPNVPNNGTPTGTLYDVTIQGGTVTLDINPTIQLLTLTGGATAGNGTLSVLGNLSWSGGTLGGNGSISTDNLAITLTSTSVNMSGTKSLTATGNTTWSSSNGFTVTLTANNAFTNLGSFTIATAGNANFSGGTFNNNGSLSKTSDDNNTLSSLFNNSGNVSVSSGILTLSGGGTQTGNFSTAATATLSFAGTQNFNTGAAFTGGNANFTTGTSNFNTGSSFTSNNSLAVSGATVNFLAGSSLSTASAILTTTAGTLNLNTGNPISFTSFSAGGGTLGGADNVTIANTTNWSAGTFGGTGSLTTKDLNITLTGASVNMSGSRSLLATGNTSWTTTAGFSISLTTNNSFTSQGNFTIATVGNAAWNGGTFNNNGAFSKTSGDNNTLSPIFNNNGTVSVSNGNLTFSGAGTDTGTYASSATGTLAFSGGTRNFNTGSSVSGSAITFSGATANFNAGSSLSILGNLTQSAGTLALNSGNNPSATNFNFNGGTINGSDPLTVSNAMTWVTGTLGGNVTLTTKDLTFSLTSGSVTMNGNSSLVSTGIANWTATAGFAINLTANNSYTNQGSLTIATLGNPSFNGGLFNNPGNISKTSPDNNTLSAIFNNSGNVSVSNGTLAFTGGGTQTGHFTASGPGILSFGGTHNFNANSTISAGNITFTSGTINFNAGSAYNVSATSTVAGATVNFIPGFTLTSLGSTLAISSGTLNLNSAANPTVTSLSMNGGTLAGADNVTVLGTTTWNAGTLGGTGSLTTKDLSISLTGGSVTMSGSRSLLSTGNATWSSTAGFAINLTANNTYTSQGNFTINTIGNPSWNNGILNNAGVFSKTSTDNNTLSATFNNSGSVSVSAGNLTLSGGGTQTGSFSTSATGILSFGGNHNFNSGATLNAGAYNFSSGNSTLHPGAVFNAATGTTTVSGAAVNFLAGTTLSSFGTTLAISSGNLTLNTGGPTPTVANFNATGGTLSGTDNLSVTSLMAWGANTLTGVGSVTTKDLNITLNNGSAALSGTRTLTATGNTTWSSTAGFAINLTTNNAFSTLGNFTLNTVGNPAFNGGTFHNAAAFSKISPDNNTISAAFDNTGSLALNAGNLSLTGGDTGNTTGTFSVVFGSTLTLAGSYALAPSAAISGAGNLILQGGNITINSTVATTGNTTVSAGTIHFAGAQSLYNPNALAITSGSVIFTNDAAKLLSITGLTLSGSNNAWGSSLDLGNNRAIVAPPVTASRATILAILENQVSFGVSHANGIHSSTHPANLGLAVLDNSITNFTTFGGQPVNANSILLGLELPGDANADGHVDLTDLSTVLNNFGSTTAAWMNGNFDGATTIDLTDLSDVLNNFGSTNPNNFAATPIPLPTPEPATALLLAIPLLFPRRRRSS